MKPKPQPPKPEPLWHVILLNDDEHSFEYVIEMLASIFGHPPEMGAKMALHVHENGRVIVATVQNATTIQPYIDGVVMVSKTEATGRNARPVATVAAKTISDFSALRRDLKVPEPV